MTPDRPTRETYDFPTPADWPWWFKFGVGVFVLALLFFAEFLNGDIQPETAFWLLGGCAFVLPLIVLATLLPFLISGKDEWDDD